MHLWRLFLSFLMIFSFVACDEGGGKKTDADIVGNDGIITDDDLLTDDLTPDEEEDAEPDETDLDIKDADKPDTDKVDTDIVDKDIIDTDTTDEDLVDVEPTDDGDTDTTDEDLVEVEPTDDGEPTDESEAEPDEDIVVTGPCTPNPCTAIEHSDGVCSEAGEEFTCGCLENYLWDEQMKECLAATQVVACENLLPEHGLWAAPNEDGLIEQVWDGDSWEPPADTCTWECDENYTWNPDSEACEADTQRVDCTNIPANAHGIGANADGKIGQVWDGDSWEPPADTCEWECNKGYVLSQSGDACVWQQVIYVKWDATGANDGTSWENAFTDLTTAIEKAVAGQEIWVAMGTYVPSKCLTTAQETCAQRPRNRTFTLPSGVAIYGGFAGTETSRDERDWASYETILSGDFNGDDTWDDINEVWLNTEENAYHVIQVIADMGMFPQDALLDGFTITHGYADDPLGIDNKGAGLAATDNENSAEITIRHCIFKDNIAAGTYSGGGAVSFANMDPIIEDTTFLANSADFAGGALSIGNGSVTLARTEFLDNTTDGNGGAIMADQSSILITEGTFLRNSAAKNGGVINANASDITIDEDSFFEDNGVTGDTDSDGGVFAVSAGTLAITSSSFYQNNAVNGASVLSATGTEISITDSAFYKNSVATASDRMYTMRIKNNVLTIHGSLFVSNTGSPLNLEGVSATIEGTEFNDNTAVNAGAIQFQGTQPLSINRCWFRNNAADIPLGGLAGVGGALFLNGMSGTPTVTITNSVFDGNHANLWGGAAAFVMASPTVVNCTFEGNTASVDGHSIAFVGSNAAINNTILWDAVTQITSAGPYNFPPSNPTFSYSDVFGSGGSGASWVLPFGTDGGGNIDEDPLFVGGTGSDPLFLMDTSPCKDTGNDALVPAGITTDLLGSNRFYGPVDMGAYEWWE